MAIIHDKLNSTVRQKITTQQIWKHLETLYDLAALNESEIIPFPKKEKEFQLFGGNQLYYSTVLFKYIDQHLVP